MADEQNQDQNQNQNPKNVNFMENAKNTLMKARRDATQKKVTDITSKILEHERSIAQLQTEVDKIIEDFNAGL